MITSNSNIIYINKIDKFFMSFHEPNAEENYKKNILIYSDIKRVSNIIGLDSVHRKCGELSKTEYLLTIDADTIIDRPIDNVILNDINYDIIQFRSINNINNLAYGNGGIKIWKKKFISTLSFHEYGNDIDFTNHNNFMKSEMIYSTTYINYSKLQAFRSGYREGYKLTNNFLNYNNANRKLLILNYLWVWCSIGMDVKNGCWAMLGSTRGVYDRLNNIEKNNINNYDFIENVFKEYFIVDLNQDAVLNYKEELRKKIIALKIIKIPKSFPVSKSIEYKTVLMNKYKFFMR